MAIWDVIVIGAGGVGSAAAMHLAKSGARTLGNRPIFSLLMTAAVPTDKHGSSGKPISNIPSYVPLLLQRAYELWDELEQHTRTANFFHRTGLVELGPIDGDRHSRSFTIVQRLTSLPIETIVFRLTVTGNAGPESDGNHDWQAVIEKNAGFLKVEECVQAHHLRPGKTVTGAN